jgi:MscS family membrane protein
LEVREDIYLRIMDIIQESGTTLTTPSTPYAPFFAKHHQQGHDPRDVTEQKVKEMKENGDLPLPKFEPSRIDALKNSLDYPSKGSSTFKGKRD